MQPALLAHKLQEWSLCHVLCIAGTGGSSSCWFSMDGDDQADLRSNRSKVARFMIGGKEGEPTIISIQSAQRKAKLMGR